MNNVSKEKRGFIKKKKEPKEKIILKLGKISGKIKKRNGERKRRD